MVNVIAEIGINHKGSFQSAKKLIKIAKETNCWGVKFQYRDINTFYKKTNFPCSNGALGSSNSFIP